VTVSIGCFGPVGEEGEDRGHTLDLVGPAISGVGGDPRAVADSAVRPTGDEEAPVAAVGEPPLRLQAVPRAGVERGEGDRPHAIEVGVAADGTFVAQLPPGTYDLEAASADDLLVGALEGLQAIAGEVRGGMNLTLGEAVSLSGTVVDEHGFHVEGTLEVKRLDQAVVRSIDTEYGGGSFTVGGLRPGTYSVVTRVGGASASAVHVSAPATSIELHAPVLLPGMLLVPRQSDGECPGHARVQMNSVDAGLDGRQIRGATFVNCRAIVWDVRPGSRWTVTGQVGPYAVNQEITFGAGPTLTPICLTGWCATDSAIVHVRIASVASGRANWLPVQVLDGPPDGPPKGQRVTLSTGGFHAGFSYTLSVGRDVVYGPMTVTLVPGVNTIVFRPR
jgi:hypothetical protein